MTQDDLPFGLADPNHPGKCMCGYPLDEEGKCRRLENARKWKQPDAWALETCRERWAKRRDVGHMLDSLSRTAGELLNMRDRITDPALREDFFQSTHSLMNGIRLTYDRWTWGEARPWPQDAVDSTETHGVG